MAAQSLIICDTDKLIQVLHSSIQVQIAYFHMHVLTKNFKLYICNENYDVEELYLLYYIVEDLLYKLVSSPYFLFNMASAIKMRS